MADVYIFFVSLQKIIAIKINNGIIRIFSNKKKKLSIRVWKKPKRVFLEN